MAAPATGLASTIEGIDALLRARWRSGLSELIERAQGRCSRFSDLHWVEIDDGMKVSVGADELLITGTGDGDHALLYPGTSSRATIIDGSTASPSIGTSRISGRSPPGRSTATASPRRSAACRRSRRRSETG